MLSSSANWDFVYCIGGQKMGSIQLRSAIVVALRRVRFIGIRPSGPTLFQVLTERIGELVGKPAAKSSSKFHSQSIVVRKSNVLVKVNVSPRRKGLICLEVGMQPWSRNIMKHLRQQISSLVPHIGHRDR